MVLMSGKELAEHIEEDIRISIEANKLRLSLAVILIGNDPASEKYVEFKKRACGKAGIGFTLWRFDDTNSQGEVVRLIKKLNKDRKTTGIIVQLPMPKNFVPNELLEAIDPAKDVDGLNSVNMGRLVKGLPGLFPATPEGVINMIRYYDLPLKGKKVAIIGQGNLVGKPLSLMLLNEEATVLLANKYTTDLADLTLDADIIISAVGVRNLVHGKMVKPGAAVIDVGTSLYAGKIVGDVNQKEVSKIAGYLTPSPGGVGPMTVAMLLSNVLKAATITFED